MHKTKLKKKHKGLKEKQYIYIYIYIYKTKLKKKHKGFKKSDKNKFFGNLPRPISDITYKKINNLLIMNFRWSFYFIYHANRFSSNQNVWMLRHFYLQFSANSLFEKKIHCQYFVSIGFLGFHSKNQVNIICNQDQQNRIISSYLHMIYQMFFVSHCITPRDGELWWQKG